LAGWDTDYTDVDLHVTEPTGEHVYYGHSRSGSTGAAVSRDFTQGYGPECYTCVHAPAGVYSVETNYYESHQDCTSTGSTSAVCWAVTHLGDFAREQIHFNTKRLTARKQRQQVLTLNV